MEINIGQGKWEESTVRIGEGGEERYFRNSLQMLVEALLVFVCGGVYSSCVSPPLLLPPSPTIPLQQLLLCLFLTAVAISMLNLTFCKY